MTLDDVEPIGSNSQNQQMRIEAIRLLVATGGADAARVLATALVYPDADFQRQMAANMVAVGAPALAAFRVVVTDSDPVVRQSAVRVLARFDDSSAEEWLVERLSDSASTVRLAAAEALSRFAHRPVIEALAAMAQRDPDEECRLAAESALHRIGGGLLAPHLKKLTSDVPADREQARTALIAEGSIVVPPLTEMLDHGNPLIRHAVADVLGEIGDPRALTPLIRAMSDPDDDVREAVAQALGHMKSENAARALIANLASPDDKLALATALALVDQGAGAVQPLIEFLGSNRRELRTSAVEILSKIRDRRATRPLTDCLSATDSWMRSAAARALGRLGDPDATEAVVSRLEDSVPLVRAAAAEALGELRVVRAAEPLIAALEDEELIVQIAAARALGKIGDEQAAEPLFRLLSRPEVSLKLAVIEALTDLRDVRSIGVLKRVLSPWPLGNEPAEVKAAARRALNSLQPRF